MDINVSKIETYWGFPPPKPLLPTEQREKKIEHLRFCLLYEAMTCLEPVFSILQITLHIVYLCLQLAILFTEL